MMEKVHHRRKAF